MGARDIARRLAKLSPCLSKIAVKVKEDEKLKQTIADLKGKNDVEMFFGILPIIAEMDEIWELVAIYNDKSIEEIENEDFETFTKQLMDIFVNIDIRTFTNTI